MTLAPTAPALLADLEAARAAVFGTGYEDPASRSRHRAGLPRAGDRHARARRVSSSGCSTSLDARDLLRVEPALAQLDVPTLVVWGTADEFFDLLGLLAPGHDPRRPDVVEIPGAKLFFPDERADELAPLLSRHWASVRTPAR